MYVDPEGLNAGVLGGGAGLTEAAIKAIVDAVKLCKGNPYCIGLVIAGSGAACYSDPVCSGMVQQVIDSCTGGGDAAAAGEEESNNDEEKSYCEDLLEIDTSTCNGVTRSRGSVRGAICHASASERYAACLTGKPLPPLAVWNN